MFGVGSRYVEQARSIFQYDPGQLHHRGGQWNAASV
jgi:hypothetical protein